jgi:hypothetical protein
MKENKQIIKKSVIKNIVASADQFENSKTDFNVEEDDCELENNFGGFSQGKQDFKNNFY